MENKPDCGFYELTDLGLYCAYSHKICDNYKECEFHKNGVGMDDLKGALTGINGGGYPIYSDD